MSFSEGGVTCSMRKTLEDGQWLLIANGTVIAGGTIEGRGHLTVFPGLEIALGMHDYKHALRRPLAHSGGVVFTFGKDGYRQQRAERAVPDS